MLLSILLMIIGESLAIFAENYAAKYAEHARTFFQWFGLIVTVLLAGICLILAYKYGYKHFDNIRIVVAISIGTILIIEPFISWMMFHEIPTHGAIAGLIFGFAGLMCSILRK